MNSCVQVFVILTDACEVFDLTRASGLVDAFSVCLLAKLKRGVDVNMEGCTATSSTVLKDVLESGFAGVLKGSNRGCDDSSTCLGKLSCHKGDALNVFVAVLAGEAKFR